MRADTPITVAVAVYADRAACLEDYHAVREAKTEGEFDHIAVAVVTKRPDESLEVERHDSTAKHLAWGGALLGGTAVLLAPAAAPVVLATSLGAGGGVTAAGLAGAGGITGHLWRNIPKEKVREMSDLLDTGESALMVVAVNKLGSDIGPLLANASKKVVDDSTKGDLEAAYNDAIAEANASS